jgi:glycosyltransferase involved in cell wall biosynthesis
MKISIVTPVFNGEAVINSCLHSVAIQDYPDKEHIIVDGLSNDKTVSIIQNFKGKYIKSVSEKDAGLYDAFNKGIGLADGDVVCFLCADDMYAHEHVLQTVAETFRSNPEADMVYGDIAYVDRINLSKVTRYWKSCSFRKGLFKKGWLPPNTALFIRRDVFKKYGAFSLKFRMASDYEMQFRFFEKHLLKSIYVPGIMVYMRSGGMSNSNLRAMYTSLKECYNALSNQKVAFPIVYIVNTLFYRLRQTRIPSHIKKMSREYMQILQVNS